MRFDADADAICSLEMRFARWRCGLLDAACLMPMRLDAVAAPAMEKARTVVERSWSRLVRRLLCIRPLPAPVPQVLCLLIGTCDSRGYHCGVSLGCITEVSPVCMIEVSLVCITKVSPRYHSVSRLSIGAPSHWIITRRSLKFDWTLSRTESGLETRVV